MALHSKEHVQKRVVCSSYPGELSSDDGAAIKLTFHSCYAARFLHFAELCSAHATIVLPQISTSATLAWLCFRQPMTSLTQSCTSSSHHTLF